jgi:cellulose synthase/poly-beta-1,6-N-acetylglucosamine synthase-like glycosyltransferase
MPELRRPASVAVVPCYNEERNPVVLASTLLAVPGLDVVFVDDAGGPSSERVLRELADSDERVTVRRNAARIGKVQSLLQLMRELDGAITRLLLVDCDVRFEPAAAVAVLEETGRSDLVLVNAKAIDDPQSFWERGAIFSANRHDRLRDCYLERYPARCTNGRMLGMSRRLVEAIVSSDVPRHTEDSHFMLVCLERGYRYAYRRDAVLQYRAPQTLDDYLRQSSRFSEGRSLLRERWHEETLERCYDLGAKDVLGTLLAQAAHDPLGALAFGTMLAAKTFQRARTQSGTWAVATSTKALR